MDKPPCPWCEGQDESYDEADLCRLHTAEFEGISLAELDRRDDEQRAEVLDWCSVVA